jgi:transposase
MRFVPGKTAQSQALLAVHRARQGFVKVRRGAGEPDPGIAFRIRYRDTARHLEYRQAPAFDPGGRRRIGLPDTMRPLMARLAAHLKVLDREADELEAQIQVWHRQNEASRKLEKIPGIGPITASALVASIGDAKNFDNGRQLAAWLGLVPRQHSSGDKPTLLGIESSAVTSTCGRC